MILTSSIQIDILPSITTVGGLCMRGRIYPRGSCPFCGGTFIENANGYFCPTHLTQPKRFYIRLYSKELHKHVYLYSDSRGNAFSSYEQAERILTKIRAEIDAGNFDITRYVAEKLKPLRFTNWSNEWLRKKSIEVEIKRKTPAYLKTLRVYIRKFQDFFEDEDIREIGAKRINDFYLSLGCSPKYAWNIMSALHKILNDALRWKDIHEMPAFPKFEVPENNMETIDLDQQDAIINAIPNLMDRAFILFTAREMVRPSETRAIQWGDLDLKHDRVTIRRHFSLNEIRPTTKAKRIKILPLDGEVKEILQSLPRHLTSPFVFWKMNGRPFSESWARKLWKRISLSFGINISLYQGTRHSSATEAADRVGIDKVQEFLYHTNRKMTERYAQKNPERLRNVLRRKVTSDTE